MPSAIRLTSPFRPSTGSEGIVRKVQAGEDGFSILEAIVILLISAMILSAILPIVLQSTAQNLRTGKRALASVEQNLDESAFRLLIRSTAPPKQSTLGRPARVTIEGDATSLSLISLSGAPVACVQSIGETSVKLVIEQDEKARSGRLVCRSKSTDRTIVTWDSSGATLEYSEDGETWTNKWPTDADRDKWERQLVASSGAAGAPLVSAPLVKFEFMSKAKGHSVWIERAGSVEPVAYDVEALFLGEDRPDERFR